MYILLKSIECLMGDREFDSLYLESSLWSDQVDL